MSRLIGTAVMAVALAVAAHAQDSTVKTETKTSGGGQMVTYTGCVQGSPQTRSFTLDHVVPLGQTTTTEHSGGVESTTTTLRYALVPGPTVEFQEFVGHKVEVTGILIPAGDSKTKTTTKTEREDGPDTKTTETVKREGGMSQFRVISIKHLADSCQ